MWTRQSTPLTLFLPFKSTFQRGHRCFVCLIKSHVLNYTCAHTRKCTMQVLRSKTSGLPLSNETHLLRLCYKGYVCERKHIFLVEIYRWVLKSKWQWTAWTILKLEGTYLKFCRTLVMPQQLMWIHLKYIIVIFHINFIQFHKIFSHFKKYLDIFLTGSFQLWPTNMLYPLIS